MATAWQICPVDWLFYLGVGRRCLQLHMFVQRLMSARTLLEAVADSNFASSP